MPRGERRAQLLAAAAQSFMQGGFAGTGLDDVATAAGVTRVIIYRHFESKRDLYSAVLHDTRERILEHVGDPEHYSTDTGRHFAEAAREVPDGFRLLYRHAVREPEFAAYADEVTRVAIEATEATLLERIPDASRRRWVAALVPAIIYQTVLFWLDAGQPVEPEDVSRTVHLTVEALIDAQSTGRAGEAPGAVR